MLKRSGSRFILLAVVLVMGGSVAGQAYPTGDLNEDRTVDFADLSLLTARWLDPDCHMPACRVNLDGIGGVDLGDFAILAAGWRLGQVYAARSALEIKRATICEFAAAEGWETTGVAANATISADGTNFIANTQSVKVTTQTNSAATLRSTAGMGIAGTLKNDASVWVFVSSTDLDSLHFIRLRFYDSYSSDYVESILYSRTVTRQRIVPNQWTELKVASKQMTQVGSTAWEGNASGYAFVITELQVGRVAGADNVSVSFANLTTDSSNKGGFVWAFDDARSGVFTYAYPVLKENGWAGVLPVISDKIGTANYLTLEQVQTLYDAGWDIVAHSKSHPIMTGLTKAQVVEQLKAPKAWLICNGFYRGSNIFVWPGNAGFSKTDEWYGLEQARPYYKILRGLSYDSQHDSYFWSMADTGSGWEPLSWEQLPYYALYVNTDDTFAGKYEDKFQAIIDRGGVICAYTHEVGPGVTGINMDLNLLNSTARWVKDQEIADKLEVVSITQWYQAAIHAQR